MTAHTPNVRRRVMEPLPSRKKHVLLALSFLTLIIAGGYLLTNFFGNAKDAEVKGIVEVAPMPLPPASDTLDGDSEALPDFLAGDVPDNVNPTEIETPKIDALGNPVDAPITETTLSGIPSSRPISTTGPRTITIDGAPIDGSGSALVPAPISGLTRVSTYGRIPAIGATGSPTPSLWLAPETSASLVALQSP